MEDALQTFGFLLVIAFWVVGIYLLVLLFWAPLKLYSIDRTLKEILEELRARPFSAASGGSAESGPVFTLPR